VLLGASFAENFYGLQRRRRPLVETERANIAVGRAGEPPKLRDRDINRSLLFLVSGVAIVEERARFDAISGWCSLCTSQGIRLLRVSGGRNIF
jgi:hypothetical protein